MKTTVEIGDELMTRVRQLARERNEPMRSLLEEALRRLIDDYARDEPRPPLHFTTFRGTGYAPGVTPQQALTMANDRGGSDHLGS
ncbi:MAG TPA: hypothetical protein VLJ88_04100 [Propionibacteriaceae bacterium]|nr:hypothetical protein [Propionibacteriaceae bacterium]